MSLGTEGEEDKTKGKGKEKEEEEKGCSIERVNGDIGT